MNVLVIGGSGFLSGAVTRQLQEAGHDVTIYTRGQRPPPAGVTVVTGDRSDHGAFVQQFAGSEYDAVVDCICYEVEDAEADVRAFAGTGAHLVMISTDFVYGRDRRLPMDEQTPRHALSPYGRKKIFCEDILFAACRERRLATTILRPPHIMGPGGQLGSGSLQGRDPMLLDRLRQGVPVVLLEGGTLLLQPVLNEDIARACVAVLDRPESFGQAYNCAGAEAVTTRQYYELIAQALGVELKVRSLPAAAYVAAYPEKEPFAYHRTYDMRRLEADTGYRPQADFAYCLFSTMDWLQENGAERPYEATPLDEASLRLCERFEAEAARVLSARG